jgi:hypothetical protein
LCRSVREKGIPEISGLSAPRAIDPPGCSRKAL